VANQDLYETQSAALTGQETKEYMALVGTLLFAAMCVRLDIAHSVNELTKSR
jgi:hypothetical protein